MRDLNRIYRENPALHLHDCRPDGFEWIESNDPRRASSSFARAGRRTQDRGRDQHDPAAQRLPNRLPVAGHWDEILCTDAESYGGGNRGNGKGLDTEAVRWHDRDQSALIDLPPLSAVVFRQA
ncbi:MAG: alpha amylase C-terminal domain-containing protein [Paracoccaceae bacterium]